MRGRSRCFNFPPYREIIGVVLVLEKISITAASSFALNLDP